MDMVCAPVVCSECKGEFSSVGELEAHASGDHLDYFPYSCGHCSHYFTTEELAHFHAKRKKHLPMKIREHVNMMKHEKLQEILQQSTEGAAAEDDGGGDDYFSGGDDTVTTGGGDAVPDDDEQEAVGVDSKNIGGQDDETDNKGSGEEVMDGTLVVRPTSPSPETISIGKSEDTPIPVEQHNIPVEPQQQQQQPVSYPNNNNNNNSNGNNGRTLHCRLCKTGVREGIENHLEKHAKMFACRHCDYTGHSKMSVKVHITWKHKELSAKTGAIDFSLLSENELYKKCFGEDMETTRKQWADIYGESSGNNASNNGPPVGVVRTGKMPSGRVYRYMFCQECGIEVIDALASQHVFQTHIKRRDMVKCGYCEYSTTYPIAEVKRHCAAKHSEYPLRLIDHRQDPDMQELYLKIRSRCFPSIQGSRAQTRYQPPPTWEDQPQQQPNQPPQGNNSINGHGGSRNGVKEEAPLSMVVPPRRNFPRREIKAEDDAEDVDENDEDVEGPSSLSTTNHHQSTRQHHHNNNNNNNNHRHNNQQHNNNNVANNERPELAILEILRKASDASPSPRMDNLMDDDGLGQGGVGQGGVISAKTGRYLTAAHIKNSQKEECMRCGEAVTHLWESRHVWKHLEEEGKARYQCAAEGCTYKTYLLRNLDMHCNYHGQGLNSEKIGLRDMTQALTPDWMEGWRDCFGDRTPPPPEGSTAARQRGKRRPIIEEPAQPAIQPIHFGNLMKDEEDDEQYDDEDEEEDEEEEMNAGPSRLYHNNHNNNNSVQLNSYHSGSSNNRNGNGSVPVPPRKIRRDLSSIVSSIKESKINILNNNSSNVKSNLDQIFRANNHQ